MSFSSVLQISVLARQILTDVLDCSAEDLLSFFLLHKMLYYEGLSMLRQIKTAVFVEHFREVNNVSLDDTQPSDDEEYEKLYGRILSFGQFKSIGRDMINSNLRMLVLHAVNLHSLDFSRAYTSSINYSVLRKLRKLKSIVFAPLDEDTARVNTKVFRQIMQGNLDTLKELRHPPLDFLDVVSHEGYSFNLDLLEVDYRTIKVGALVSHDDDDVFIIDVLDAFYTVINQRVKAKKVILHGHNRTHFQTYYGDLIKSAGVKELELIAAAPDVINDDLHFLREWRNRNNTFPEIKSFNLMCHDTDVTKGSIYEILIDQVSNVFPKIASFTFSTNRYYSADDIRLLVTLFRQTWKRKTVNFEHRLNVTVQPQTDNGKANLINHLKVPLPKKVHVDENSVTLTLDTKKSIELNIKFLPFLI